MRTPEVLYGKLNPRTGMSYGKTIKESLGGGVDLRDAQRERDIRLGHIRAEEELANGGADDRLDNAFQVAAERRKADPKKIVSQWEDEDRGRPVTGVVSETDVFDEYISDTAHKIEDRHGHIKARRWFDVARGEATPLSEVYERCIKDLAKSKSKTWLADIRKAVEQFTEFAGEDVPMEVVDRRMVAEFVLDYLPEQKSPKAPEGIGPATIQKRCTALNNVWIWAVRRGFMDQYALSPWTHQSPSKGEIEAALSTPEQKHTIGRSKNTPLNV